MKKEEVMKVIHPHLAPTDECQCEAYREYLRTKKNKQPNYWIDSECKKYDHYSDRTNMFKEREPQKECDHIVGFCMDYLVLESDHYGTEKLLSGGGFKFKRCPGCGEKINLKKY